ncbi:MAG: ATP-dependent helicase [Fusobacteriaceae bacterium]
MSILNGLNEYQRAAAAKIDGALLILAGAGSGKTRTITYRIAHMILEKGVSPYSILAVTFTNKAAKEMRERVERLVGEDAHRATISTFHSFAMRLLRIYAEKIGFDSNFTIYDGDDQKRVIKNICKDLVIPDKKLTESILASHISKLKENSITPEEYEKENRFQPNSKIITEVYRRYNSQLRKNNCMDFADILVNCHKLLEIDEIAEKIATKYRYIMVDEYQDTNDIQYRIVKKIAEKYGNICVVGDENQSIYGFRGANIKNILDFEKDYPDAMVIKLEENYRSTSAILDAANAVIKHNTTSRDKKLWTKKQQGEQLILAHCKDGREEAEMVVNRIKELKNRGKGYSDFTILYRTNAQSRNFEEAFLKHNIPYKIFGGMQFYQRAEIKDILSYLTFVNNSKDTLSFGRIINTPKRKIGDKTLEKIVSYAKDKEITAFEALESIDEIDGIGPAVKVSLDEFYTLITELREMSREYAKVSEIFEKLLSEIGYEKYIENNYPDFEGRLENIDELRNSISELEKIAENLTLGEYLENVSLVSATDELEESSQYVKLMTIHNSKGLEFPVVFLTGVEDEIFPGKMADFEKSTLEEERRLCYVAITRAEEELVISYADARYMYGDMNFRTRSRFIKEIPTELLKERIGSHLEEQRSYAHSSLGRESLKRESKIENFSLDRFENMKKNKNYPYLPGEKVMHKKFGLGIVRDMDEKRVVVEFVDGTKEIAAIIADKFLEKHS